MRSTPYFLLFKLRFGLNKEFTLVPKDEMSKIQNSITFQFDNRKLRSIHRRYLKSKYRLERKSQSS